MVEKELHDLIKQIQARGCEEQTTEVKAAHGGCPEKLYDTISSFANQNSGGTFVFGLDEEKLRNMMGLGLTKTNINEFGRLDELKKSVDKAKAKAYFEKKEGVKLIPPKVNQKVDSLLREFIVTGGFEV